MDMLGAESGFLVVLRQFLGKQKTDRRYTEETMLRIGEPNEFQNLDFQYLYMPENFGAHMRSGPLLLVETFSYFASFTCSMFVLSSFLQSAKFSITNYDCSRISTEFPSSHHCYPSHFFFSFYKGYQMCKYTGGCKRICQTCRFWAGKGCLQSSLDRVLITFPVFCPLQLLTYIMWY